MKGAVSGAALLTSAALVAGACELIGPGFFRPVEEGPPDTTPPAFANPRLAPGIEVVNTTAFTIEVADPADGNLPGSGIAPNGIEVTRLGGAALPTNITLPTITVLLTGVPEGPIQVAVSARDRAGNQAVFVFSHIIDKTPPPLSFTFTPGDLLQSSDRLLQVTLSVQVGPEPHFDSGTVEIRSPGQDGMCGTADDGAAAEVVGEPTRTMTMTGSFTFVFFLSNPVPPGGAPRTIPYCWNARASDRARDREGRAGVNTTSISRQSFVIWRSPPL